MYLDFRYQQGYRDKTTAGNAFNSSTYIDLNSDLELILAWLRAGTAYIFSTDPQPKQYHKSSSGGTYSENFARVTAASFYFEYTVNKISLSPNSSYNLGESSNLTWENPNGYTAKISLISGNQSQSIYEGSGTSTTFIPAKSFASLIPNSINLAASLTIETLNGSESIGSNSYSITLKTTSSFAPTCQIKLQNYTNFSDQNLIIANHTNLLCEAETSTSYGASITKYNWVFPDGKSETSASLTKKFNSQYLNYFNSNRFKRLYKCNK